MNSPSAWQPITQSERYRAVDILRGLALFGVLMVNLLGDFRLPLLEHIFNRHTDAGWVNRLTDDLVTGILEFKAITMFSFLFGVSMAIQAERAAARHVSAAGFLARRMAWLFVLGAVHMFLIWNGDILMLYAVCGLLLVPALRLPSRVLIAIGAAAIVLPEYVSIDISFPSRQEAVGWIAQARDIYGHGGIPAILAFRWHETRSVIAPLLIDILPRTVGLMYLGAAAWRGGILREPDRYAIWLRVALVAGGGFGAVITAREVLAKSSAAGFAGPLLLAMAYTSAVLIWLNSRRASRLPGLAGAGQMALTNYLVQSIVLGFVFYGYGLGLFGRLESAAAACIGIALYAAQLQFSRWWLSRYRFGPFEWLWRSLAYGRRQPFLRQA